MGGGWREGGEVVAITGCAGVLVVLVNDILGIGWVCDVVVLMGGEGVLRVSVLGMWCSALGDADKVCMIGLCVLWFISFCILLCVGVVAGCV